MKIKMKMILGDRPGSAAKFTCGPRLLAARLFAPSGSAWWRAQTQAKKLSAVQPLLFFFYLPTKLEFALSQISRSCIKSCAQLIRATPRIDANAGRILVLPANTTRSPAGSYLEGALFPV